MDEFRSRGARPSGTTSLETLLGAANSRFALPTTGPHSRGPRDLLLSDFITRRPSPFVAASHGASSIGDIRDTKRKRLEEAPAGRGRLLPDPGLSQEHYQFPPEPPPVLQEGFIPTSPKEEGETEEVKEPPATVMDSDDEQLHLQEGQGLFYKLDPEEHHESERPWWSNVLATPARMFRKDNFVGSYINPKMFAPLKSTTARRFLTKDNPNSDAKVGPHEKLNGKRRRKDVPVKLGPSLYRGGKPTIKSALKWASPKAKRDEVVEYVENHFYANSSRASKAAKSAAVSKILQRAFNETYPLTSDKIKTLTGSLKAAGYKSTYAYLAEAKINHIEAGWAWTPQLDRQYRLCVTASKRGIGPRKKAPEVQEDVWSDHSITPDPKASTVALATHLFALGVHWMMREIEIAALTTNDVIFDKTNRVVSLVWRVSKTDTKAEGMRRALQCLCQQNQCDLRCPYAVLEALCNKAKLSNNVDDLLAADQKGYPATKRDIVKDWQNLYGKEVTGHSTRRSGALQYIRKGWTISQVAFLGRWKSNIIMEYAQEALQSLAVNVGSKFDFGNGPQIRPKEDGHEGTKMIQLQQASVPKDKVEIDHILKVLKDDISKFKKDTKAYTLEVAAQVADLKEQNKKSVKYLPTLVKSLRHNTVHVNTKTLICVQPTSWRTLCGWHFHLAGKYEFVEGTMDGASCIKCTSIAHCKWVVKGRCKMDASWQMSQPIWRLPAAMTDDWLDAPPSEKVTQLWGGWLDSTQGPHNRMSWNKMKFCEWQREKWGPRHFGSSSSGPHFVMMFSTPIPPIWVVKGRCKMDASWQMSQPIWRLPAAMTDDWLDAPPSEKVTQLWGGWLDSTQGPHNRMSHRVLGCFAMCLSNILQ